MIVIFPFLYNKYRTKQLIELEDLRTPWEIALDELNELVESPYLTFGQIKAYHVILSKIIRKFLSRVLKLFILETTTDRIPNLLHKNNIDNILVQNIHKFLLFCDMIKFAKNNPDKELINKYTNIARNIIRDITNKYAKDFKTIYEVDN